jgi:hypothetical protein
VVVAPVQLLVIGYPGTPVPAPRRGAGLTGVLDLVGDGGAVRVVDYQGVRKEIDGEAVLVDAADLRLPPPPGGGRVVRALLGVGAAAPDPGRYLTPGDWYWYLDDVIPPGATVVLVLVEHRWAAPFTRALTARGANLLHDAWVHPSDLASSMTTRDG